MPRMKYSDLYKQIIVQKISFAEYTPIRRSNLFYDFLMNGSVYYERLCDALYVLSAREIESDLWLKPNGDVYISVVAKSPDDVFLISGSDLPYFDGDLHEQLSVIWICLYKLIKIPIFTI